MQFKSIIVGVVAGALSIVSLFNVAHASLIVGELNGTTVVYDDVSKLTWLQDAFTYGSNADWTEVNNWALALDLDKDEGADGWRLPNLIGIPAKSDVESDFDSLLSNDNALTFFSNMQTRYWVGDSESVSDKAYFVDIGDGIYGRVKDKTSGKRDAWAVFDGNFANLKATDVPEPTSLAIFGFTLLGLVSRKFKKK